MEIDYFEFYPKGDKDQASGGLGLNINQKDGLTNVNLFALAENTGSLISDNFWHITRQISDAILMGKKIDDINWTLTSGSVTTSLKFSTLRGQPYKLDIADDRVIRAERFKGVGTRWSLDDYSDAYDVHSLPNIKEGGIHKNRMFSAPEPRRIFLIPCDHPSAKDGVFHCQSPEQNADRMGRKLEVILVDTGKLIMQLSKDDPEMLRYAERKFGETSVEEWLEGTSMGKPRDMGQWSFRGDQGERLSLYAGQGELIQLVQELDLPYFPIAIAREDGAAALKEKMGYGSVACRDMGLVYRPS